MGPSGMLTGSPEVSGSSEVCQSPRVLSVGPLIYCLEIPDLSLVSVLRLSP